MLLLHSNPITTRVSKQRQQGLVLIDTFPGRRDSCPAGAFVPLPYSFPKSKWFNSFGELDFLLFLPSETETDWCTRKAKIDINRRLCLDLTGSQRVMAAGEDVPWNYLRKSIIFNLMFICSSTTHSMIEVGKSQSILISNSDLWTASISFNSDSTPGCPIHQLRCFNYRSFRFQTYNSIVK